MSSAVFGEKARSTVSAAGAVAILATLLLLFRFPPRPLPLPTATATHAKPMPPVQIAKAMAADAVLKEETELRDLRPLFLPTEHNAALPEPRREPGRTFLDDENLKLGLAEGELTLSRDLLAPVETLTNPASGQPISGPVFVAAMSGLGAVGIGREEAPIEPVPPRAAYVEVIETATGRHVFGDALPASARFPGDKPWEPVEFLAVVDPVGLAAPLVVTSSSRVEEVDTHFRNFLARSFRIGERLPPGFYRIVVGP
jgi:hypothetical protein